MIINNKTTKVPELCRTLKARHLIMIANGGSIGAGLFVASGAIISVAGPGGALFSYILIGLMVYFLMTSLCELAAYMPVSGSFSTYGQKYVEEGFGFAVGWNYWYNWVVTIAVDLVAALLVMGWWFPDVPGWIWSVLFLTIFFSLNYISVRGFGEVEYWFSLIKVITVIIFIIIGMIMAVRILKESESVGWSNWITSNTSFSSFSAMVGGAMIVGFSFQGTELIGIAAGESENPEKNIPRAVRLVFWRILIFYVFTILIISLIIPHTDPNLLRNESQNISISPFTLVFQHSGLLSAAAVMNSVILIAILSAGNSGMYASARMLYTLACDGKAPHIFARLSYGGVPRNALYATTLIAVLFFLASTFDNLKGYLWLLNTSGTTGFIAWMGIAISHYRFRRGYVIQGYNVNDLPYHSSFFPFGPIFSFVLCLFIVLGQNYTAFFADIINWGDIIVTYVSMLLFLVIWFSYKLAKKTHFIRYSDMLFSRQSNKK